jgi:hypothetical protein
VPRPDNKPDNLGLTVLDETASTQSRPQPAGKAKQKNPLWAKIKV